jgi:hypothetical protein
MNAMHDRERPPCVIQLMGGLGNQILQYAFGLAFVNNVPEKLWLNLDWYRTAPATRKYLLPKIFSKVDIQITTATSFKGGAIKVDCSDAPGVFVKQLLEIDRPAVFRGYFQHRDFYENSLKFMKGVMTESILERQENNLVSQRKRIGIHLRRGDFKNDLNARIHGCISIDRINSALSNFFASEVNQLNSFEIQIFSDDPIEEDTIARVQNAVNNEFVSKFVGNEIESFIAIANCEYVFCSNSTFSYCATALSKRIHKAWLPRPWMISNVIFTDDIALENHSFFASGLG